MEMNNKKRPACRQAGFSLIEVIVTVAIISFLTVFIVPYLRSQTFKANDGRRKAELYRISQALEEYEKDFSCYPQGPISNLNPYLAQIPRDPIFKTEYPYETDGTTCPRWYRIFSRLQYTKDPDYKVNIGPVALPKIYNYVITSPNAP